MLCLGLLPKAELMKKSSAGKREMHRQREMSLLLEGRKDEEVIRSVSTFMVNWTSPGR